MELGGSDNFLWRTTISFRTFGKGLKLGWVPISDRYAGQATDCGTGCAWNLDGVSMTFGGKPEPLLSKLSREQSLVESLFHTGINSL